MRCAHLGTSFDQDDRCVELAWRTDVTEDAHAPAPPPATGLAFDASCRLYHVARAGDPEAAPSGLVERVLWAAEDPLQQRAEQATPVDVIAGAAPEVAGDFAPVAAPGGPLRDPRGIAVDAGDRLFVAEAGRNRILVYDLWSRRRLRTIALAAEGAAGPSPIAVAARGAGVVVLVANPAGLFSLTLHGALEPLPIAGLVSPTRVAVSPSGRVAVLDPGAGKILFAGEDFAPEAPPHATDIAFLTDESLVVALRVGEDFVRVPVGPPELRFAEPAMRARGYDGLGIARTPDGRIVYWTRAGRFRHAVAARRRYDASGSVITFRLDSGEWQTTWGRVFLDACIPEGASVRIACVAADEIREEPELARTPPANATSVAVAYPELSPPMPPLSLVPTAAALSPIHARESGRELPWAGHRAGDRFVTYEAPIQADPGRYLWIAIELAGDTRVSPRVRCVRAEHPAHDYLRRLPRAFSRDPAAASFLLRYLAMFEGFLGDLDARGAQRATLLDPHASPDELLPWLASFLGLVLDGRWPNDRRRALIAEIADLFRSRGTLRSLTRMLELYLGVAPAIVEHFRLPGPGGAVLGRAGAGAPPAVVGATFRVGGAIATGPRDVDAAPAADATETHAHRFTVVVPGALDEEQSAVVRDIIEAHKPAHTLYDVCAVGGGVRLGVGLHVGISTLIGRTAAFVPAVAGGWALGVDAVVGRPTPGIIAGSTRLGRGSQVG